VADLAAVLDDDPGSMRRELRAILAWGRLPLRADRARLRQLAERIDPAKEPVLGLLTLTRALRVAGEEALAERLLRKALTARPRQVVLYHALGDLLTAQQPPRWREAVEFYRVARGLRPDLGVTLATALWRSGRRGEALDLLAVLVKESPDNPYLHSQQADALLGRHDLDGAIACYKKALELDPTLALTHNNLGTILCDHKHDYDGAMSCFHRAIDLDPKHAQFHYNLGIALTAQHDLDGAIACYKKALELDSTNARAHYNLGNALRDKGDWDGAIACYKKILELDPKDSQAHGNLGNALLGKHDLDGAIACYKKALELDPKDAISHYNLGIALYNKHDLDGAIACYKKALELDSKYAEAHCNLGHVLRQQGRLTEAVTSLRRGHELGSKRPDWRYPSAQWLRDAERLADLDGKLPAILTGEASPANSGEAVTLAQMCQQYKRRYVAATRLYADAFAAEPKLAADWNAQHRYNAASSAALAAAGRGEDVRLLPDKVAAMFRRWALGWLRDDLTAYAKLAQQNNPAAKQVVQQRLTRWRSDSDLASVRDPATLNRLPDDERAAWQALWRDVDELAKRVAKTDTAKKK
jgi:tetratricopeptide (TPR) repeat protein